MRGTIIDLGPWILQKTWFFYIWVFYPFHFLTRLSVFFESSKRYWAEIWTCYAVQGALWTFCGVFWKNYYFARFCQKTSNFLPFSHKLAFLKGHISKRFENFKNPRPTFLKTLLKIVCTNFQFCNLYSILKTWINVRNSIEKRLLFYYIWFSLYFRNPLTLNYHNFVTN